MRPYVLEQLAALCQAHPIQLKVIFVPSPQIGYNLTTALAASGQSWLNLQTATPSAWAAEQLEPRLSAEGRRMVTQDAALLHLEDMLDRAGESAARDYFADLPRSPGLTRSFLRTLQSLRSAGVSAEELEGAGAAPTRSRPLAVLYREYRAWQEEEGRYDEAELFGRAIALLPEPASDADGTVYAVLDETPLAGLAFRYVEALSRGGLYRIGREDYGCDPPPHSAAVRFSGAPFPPTAASHVGPGARLLAEGLSPTDGEHLRLRRALGAENEVRAALREVLHQDIALDTVEIAYTRESPYLALLHDAAERFQIPVSFAEGVPVTLTRPGQALAGFYRWIGSGRDPAEVVGICRAGLIAFDRVLTGDEIVEPHLLGTLLRADRARRAAPGHAAPRGNPLSEAEPAPELAARRLADALLALVPPGSRIAVRDLTEASVRFLRDFAPVRSERDATARDSLVLRLQEIGADVELTAPLPRLVRALNQLNSEHKIGASVAEPGHLHVVPLARAGYASRERVYIAGLDESSFPGGAMEDPILLDDERVSLSAQLSLQRTRPGEQVWQLMRVLGMAPGRVTLLASCRNLVDGRETHVSPLFHQAAEQLTGGHPENVPLIGSVPPADQALDEVESMLAARREANFSGAVGAAFPWLVAGEAASVAREAPEITRYDGWLRLDAPDLDLADGTQVLSASQLEALTACPYRYFLRYVLEAEAPDEIEEDPAH